MESRIRQIALNGRLQFADVEFGHAKRYACASFTDASAQTNITTTTSPRRYLIASITKPIVAMAVLKLAAEGECSLSERIGRFSKPLARAAYRRITLRHLLTHTSGFPDMVPNNAELRQAHAPLSEFLAAASTVDTEFATGTNCRYSSIGFLILGEVIQELTSMTAAEFINREFFQPLRMTDSWLGIPSGQADEVLPTILPCLLPVWQPNADNWGWNSSYWRTLGAPWGGMISSAKDLGKFARMILNNGVDDCGRQILPASVVETAISDQLQPFMEEPSYAGSRRAWGFGWRQQWAAHPAAFSDFVSSRTAGHWGATGTLMWIDQNSGRYGVFLTTTPYEDGRTTIQQMSNIAAQTSND